MSRSTPKAPWRSRFEEHIPVTGNPLLSLATVSRHSHGNAFPRVRTCVLRGFFAGLDLHPDARRDMKSASGLAGGPGLEESGKDDDDASYLNPRKYESDLLTITTDVRSEKVGHIMTDVDGEWRLKGKAYIIGGDSSDRMELKAREEIEKSMRLRGEGDTSTSGTGSDRPWSWETEITTHFANLSPGTFMQDLPGAPKSGPASTPQEAPGGGKAVSDLHEPMARKNFRVVVIKPEEVEYIHDEGTGNSKNERFRWELVSSDSSTGGDGQWHWKEEELWP
ncbi:uncharacterized protein GIQ15_02409 [Arthroderma uncinatum]|uniref:uncharacterized protein n=1 Tax=Arthroderma uncinatum TaxID=74035 RepID=UPI00144A900E|nr:uncharacterized protein GIQ15_02409 [Arthroderma uncinatum]KAF3483085.1 hypothetical protein GIQ15_02409 [Arthroderma uncinatum]